VPVTIVHLLEPVEIGKKEHQVASLPARDPHLLLGQRQKSAPIVQTGEFVRERGAPQVLLFLLARRDIANCDGNAPFHRHRLMPQPRGCKPSGRNPHLRYDGRAVFDGPDIVGEQRVVAA